MASSADEQVRGIRLSEAFPDAKVSSMVAAARSGNFRRVNELIVGGVDVNYRGAHGITPLAWVVAANDLGAVRHLARGEGRSERQPRKGRLRAQHRGRARLGPHA